MSTDRSSARARADDAWAAPDPRPCAARTWCVGSDADGPHDGPHLSVTLPAARTGPDGHGSGAAWWFRLVEDGHEPGGSAGGPRVVVEGHPDVDDGPGPLVRREVDLDVAGVLLEALDSGPARDSLWCLVDAATRSCAQVEAEAR